MPLRARDTQRRWRAAGAGLRPDAARLPTGARQGRAARLVRRRRLRPRQARPGPLARRRLRTARGWSRIRSKTKTQRQQPCTTP